MNNVNIPFDAIAKLIEYMERDERKHFEEMLDNGEDVSDPGHIYVSVRAVADWLTSQGVVWDSQAEFAASFVKAVFAEHGVTVADEN